MKENRILIAYIDEFETDYLHIIKYKYVESLDDAKIYKVWKVIE